MTDDPHSTLFRLSAQSYKYAVNFLKSSFSKIETGQASKIDQLVHHKLAACLIQC